VRLLYLLALMALPVQAQSPVDQITSAMDSLSSYRLEIWKWNPDLEHKTFDGNPCDRGFDDAEWRTCTLGQILPCDSSWIRKEIRLPEKILNVPVKGKISLLLNVWDSAILWINGERKGSFSKEAQFVLSLNAKPGDVYSLAVKGYNSSQTLRMLNAELILLDAEPIRKRVKGISQSFRFAQELLDTGADPALSAEKRMPNIDRSTLDPAEKNRLNALLQKLVMRVDLAALKKFDFAKFDASITMIRPEIKPLAEFAKRFTLYFTSNAHIDAAWTWRYNESIRLCGSTFASVLRVMNLNPDITYSQSSAQFYQWMQESYPEVFEGIKARVRDGRWEIVGGLWIEPDCNLIDGVSWSRQLLYAQDYYRRNFGVEAKIDWNPDGFGFNANMPMLLANAGIEGFVTHKLNWNDTNPFPYHLFWWESPDGSRVLTCIPFGYDNDMSRPQRLLQQLRKYEAHTGLKKLIVLFGFGDHGGGPTLDMLERIRDCQALDIFPNVEFGTANDYFAWVKSQNPANLPVWRNELYLEYHRGVYTTRADVKAHNRQCTNLLSQTEMFSSISRLFGGRYYSGELDEAWRKVMFNQFHDILPGTSIPSVYQDASRYYESVLKDGSFLLRNALALINKQIDTSPAGAALPITVYNPLAWNRTDLVKYRLADGDEHDYFISDINGKELACQRIASSRFSSEILFIADHVPALGYKTFLLKKGKTGIKTVLSTRSDRMVNNFFIVDIDTLTGCIKQITDKRNGKAILSGAGNQLQMLEDKGGYWNYNESGVTFPLRFHSAKVIENGPVRSIVRVYSQYPDDVSPTSFFEQDIILYEGIDRIDFTLKADYQEKFTMLKVAFPLAVTDTVATYEIPYGTIQRPTGRTTNWQKARFEVPALQWADLSAADYGVSLLNNAKHGYDVAGQVMRLSLLRTPPWAKFPVDVTDLAEHVVEYSLYPHRGDWRQANTVQQGYNFNQPLMAAANTVHKGQLGAEHSFVKIDKENLILTSIKKALHSDDWVIQWYESQGRDTEALLSLPGHPVQAFASNVLEENIKPLKLDGAGIRISSKKYSVTTIKVHY
jgi:alpha-mannosidase